jgi:peptide/nickel transport system permease protein
VRGSALVERRKEYVEAAQCLALPPSRIILRHLLPNCLAPMIVVGTLQTAHAISLEATLSFLGVGLLPPTPSWGAMLAESVSFFYTLPTYLFIPGTALFIVVLAFNLLGDAVRDALDPRAGRA